MNQVQIFSVAEGLSIILWMFILYWIGRSIRSRYNNINISRFFYLGWGFKIFFALVFALVYLFALGGGDINAYWESATVLNKLFVDNPMGYIQELWSTERSLGITYHFNSETGYPPGWIWRESEAWNAAKILSILSVLTFNSFWATTLLIASFVFFTSWLMVYRITTNEAFNSKAVMFAFLFLPSVTFWCSGISKDSQVYTLSLLLIYQLFLWLKWDPKRSIWRVLLMAFIFYLILNLRQFIALAIIGPFLLSIVVRYGSRLSQRPVILLLFRLFVYALLVSGFIFIANAEQTQALIQEAQITQSDFSQNPIYSGAKYELSTMDGTPTGILLAMPESVFIALYRPFITENLGLNFVVNELESLLLIFFSLWFLVNKNVYSNIRYLFKSEFAIYTFTFVLLIAFMAGYTSILFGVLVRIRAIALPFFFLLLTFRKPKAPSTT
jgi:hypothetical protein